ncbi:hypothetical protein OUZ56_003409 [Daphnia magna]|uniref:Secreted protein n=1 Tax=Daphnia magna TaxID=35525 RepID=A0ABR0A8V7_9CRUS|nr:hypothetical protein OUZ56_003409 [Daphnia magna]
MKHQNMMTEFVVATLGFSFASHAKLLCFVVDRPGTGRLPAAANISQTQMTASKSPLTSSHLISSPRAMAENSHSSTATHTIVEQESENEETEEVLQT